MFVESLIIGSGTVASILALVYNNRRKNNKFISPQSIKNKLIKARKKFEEQEKSKSNALKNKIVMEIIKGLPQEYYTALKRHCTHINISWEVNYKNTCTETFFDKNIVPELKKYFDLMEIPYKENHKNQSYRPYLDDWAQIQINIEQLHKFFDGNILEDGVDDSDLHKEGIYR